nr:hypothetical protein [Tanacetum cinerariifolium]
MKESKAYKTYLGYASGVIAHKIARKFKKAYPSKKDSSLVHVNDEPAKKGKQVKRPAKKSTTTPVVGIFISEAPMEIQSKRKEKVDVARSKGIELLSEVALAEKADIKEEKENLEINQEQVVEDAYVTILTVAKETIVPVASSSHSSNLALKFLNFTDIHPNDAEILYPLDVYVHHEFPSTYTSTLLTVPVLVIPESSPVCTTIPQSSQTFTSPLLLTTPSPPPTIETTDTPTTVPNFALVF